MNINKRKTCENLIATRKNGASISSRFGHLEQIKKGELRDQEGKGKHWKVNEVKK